MVKRKNKKEAFQLKLQKRDHKFQEKLMDKRLEQERKIQIMITILIIGGMLISGSLGAYIISLTIDKDPYLIVSPYKVDFVNNALFVQVANIKDNPATIIQVSYKIEEATQKEVAETEEGETNIPYLSKGRDFVKLDLKKLDEQIVRYCKETLKGEVSFMEEFDSVNLQKDFKILLFVSYENYKPENILQTKSTTYTRDISCWYLRNKEGIAHEFGSSWGVSY